MKTILLNKELQLEVIEIPVPKLVSSNLEATNREALKMLGELAESAPDLDTYFRTLNTIKAIRSGRILVTGIAV